MSTSKLAGMLRAALYPPCLLLGLGMTAGCGSTINGSSGDEGGGGSEGSPTTSGLGGGTSSSTAPTMSAMALTRAQRDALWEEENGGDTASSSSAGGLDPNDLFLMASDVGVSCGEAYVDLPCGFHWSVGIGVPPALQAVGVYPLDGAELSQYSLRSETSALHDDPQGPDDCAVGFGPLSGTLEILAIDETAVHFRLTVSDDLWDTDPSGEYVAPRCP